MSKRMEVTVPDIGDFHDVPVIEVLVAPGDSIQAEDPLVTLESDKATMEVPAPGSGTVIEVLVKVGDTVSEGTPILLLESLATTGEASATTTPAARTQASGAQRTVTNDLDAEVLVLGAGPGGYTAAFRAADLGKKVVLVERHETLGGVCLNVGCIPSKALLHAAEVINGAQEMAARGVAFAPPEIDLERLGGWKNGVVKQLTRGLAGLAKQRKVQVVHGEGRFTGPHSLAVSNDRETVNIGFEQAIVAAGSRPTVIPTFPNDDPRLMDSTGALRLEDVPGTLLVIGGGIIGLEMATVYQALGSKITVVELLDGLIPGCDRDLVRPLQKRLQKHCEAIYLATRVTAIKAGDDGLKVVFDGPQAPSEALFDRVLVSVGRRPNGLLIGAENAGVAVDEAGFIHVDRRQRTNVAHIFAIGDVVGQPMLAHKATHEAVVAAEVAAGMKSGFDALAIPAVAYTDPEIAWTGLSETEAKNNGVAYEKAVFPWAASGRALGIGRSEGITKLLVDPESRRVLGAGIVGPHAGDLIAEATLAIEMGADAEDLGLTIHPHPTLSETLGFAAEMAEGTITDLYVPRKK